MSIARWPVFSTAVTMGSCWAMCARCVPVRWTVGFRRCSITTVRTATWAGAFERKGRAQRCEGSRGEMPKRRLMPKGHWDWSLPVTLSQGWKAGDLIFVGGQISADAKGRTVAPGDIEAQARNVMGFIERVLEDAGAGMKDVVKHNVYYVVDGRRTNVPALLAGIDTVRAEYFSEPGPVTTETPVAGLAYEGLLLEIEAIAYLGRDKERLMPK